MYVGTAADCAASSKHTAVTVRDLPSDNLRGNEINVAHARAPSLVRVVTSKPKVSIADVVQDFQLSTLSPEIVCLSDSVRLKVTSEGVAADYDWSQLKIYVKNTDDVYSRYRQVHHSVSVRVLFSQYMCVHVCHNNAWAYDVRTCPSLPSCAYETAREFVRTGLRICGFVCLCGSSCVRLCAGGLYAVVPFALPRCLEVRLMRPASIHAVCKLTSYIVYAARLSPEIL